jgi:DDE superfamily endonuclease
MLSWSYPCIGWILVATYTTRKNECANTADYFSGHKRVAAINVQAAVDHQLRFRYVCVAAPGKCNDGRAFSVECTRLKQWLGDLDEKYFICADNAYPISNKLLVPFKGPQAAAIYHASYNFYLSQLRIRVEMAFGRMTTKFRILRGKLSCTLVNQSKVIQAVTRLHNFIIDNDQPN